MVGVHAIVDLLAPTKSLDFYGLADISKNPDPKVTFIVLEMGALLMNSALVLALQIFQGLPSPEAVAWSCWLRVKKEIDNSKVSAYLSRGNDN